MFHIFLKLSTLGKTARTKIFSDVSIQCESLPIYLSVIGCLASSLHFANTQPVTGCLTD